MSSPSPPRMRSQGAIPPLTSCRLAGVQQKADGARRRWWSRTFFLILAVAIATVAFAAILICALPRLDPPNFVSFSSYEVLNVHSDMPLIALLPPPASPPPSSSLVAPGEAPAVSRASAFYVAPFSLRVSTEFEQARARNSTLEGGAVKDKRREKSAPEGGTVKWKRRANPAPPGGVTVKGKMRAGSSRPPHTERPLWSLPPDEALAHAKLEIERAPRVIDDPDLHAPLFRNVSVFRRSYELMERILKVYVYRDGARPIFHTPPLKGIYASEGWFMKLMEENKQFAARDPNKAHLFYLPYSSRRLQEALYVPDSHNMRPLALFLKDYVNMIARKYPFWNRTHGSDHFLVACHDWGPYVTTLHHELGRNAIKVLCNADASEGIFVRGKDVSLPETSIRIPKRPLKFLGGKPISQRSILAFFAGQMHGRVRPILLKHWGGKDDDMRIYGPLPIRVSRTMSYIHHMKTSKFCICPMGFEVNSPRIVEAIYYECVPVIIADNFVPPFDEVLDWNSFSVIVAEKDIPDLKNILQRIPLRRYISMQTNVKRLQKHFHWHAKPVKYDLFHMILHSIWFNRLNEIDAKH